MGFVDNVIQAVAHQGNPIQGWVQSTIMSVIARATGMSEAPLVEAPWDAMMQDWARIRDNPQTPLPIRNLFTRYDQLPFPLKMLALTAFIAAGVPLIVKAQLGGVATKMEQVVQLGERPRILSPPEVLNLYMRGLVSDNYAASVLATNGYTDDDLARLIVGSRTQLDPTAIRDSFLRGFISEPENDGALHGLGYSTQDIGLIKKLYGLIPTVSDIIPMAVKDVFDKDARKRLDLDAEFPSAVLEWANKQGLSEFWAKNYWAAHWNLPSPTQGFEMLHRRLLTPAELDDLIRAQDYAPVWRERLRKISFNIPTRVDSRRMFEIDVINREELKSLLMDGGYDETNAERLTKFYEKNAVEGDVSKKKRVRDLTAGMMSEAFRDGIISEDQYHAFLLQLNYDADEAGTLVSIETYKRDRAWLKEFESSVKALFVKGFWTDNQSAEALASVGYDQPTIERLLSVWVNLRDARELTDEEKAQRDLTKADVIDGYITRSLTRKQASDFLVTMHYDTPEVDVLLANADTKRRKAEIKDATDLITLLYVNGQISRADVLMRLDALVLPARERDALMERLEVERRRALTKLNLGQIRAFFENKQIGLPDVIAELKALGYSQVNVDRFSYQWSNDYILDPRGFIVRAKPVSHPAGT